MKTRYHRTCIRMGEKEYRMLRKKSADAGRAMNKWLIHPSSKETPTGKLLELAIQEAEDCHK